MKLRISRLLLIVLAGLLLTACSGGGTQAGAFETAAPGASHTGDSDSGDSGNHDPDKNGNPDGSDTGDSGTGKSDDPDSEKEGDHGPVYHLDKIELPPAGVEFAAYSLIATFEPGTNQEKIRKILAEHNLWTAGDLRKRDEVTTLGLVMKEHPLYGESEGRLVEVEKGAKAEIIDAESNTAKVMLDRMRAFLDESLVVSVGFNTIKRLALTPNDKWYDSQDWLNREGENPLMAESAWDFTTASELLNITIHDTGVSFSHPDLEPRIDTINSDDFIITGTEPNTDGDADCSRHGTSVAGMAAATGNETPDQTESVGVAGLDWKSNIISFRIADAGCSIYHSDAVAAADYLSVLNNSGTQVHVANLSYGSAGPDPDERLAFEAAFQSGTLLIAAAGNDGDDIDEDPFYPASYKTVSAVSATDKDFSRSIFGLSGSSNYGDDVEYAGQGGPAFTTSYVPSDNSEDDDTWAYFSGTSAASPSVAGVALLGWSLAPEMENTEVRDVLHDTGVNIDDENPNFAGQLGRHVNARNFVRAMRFEMNDDHAVENDEDPEPLTLGEFHKSGAAYPSDQTDWYVFDGVSEGDDLLFTLNWEDSSSDVDLLLYGPDRHLVKEGHSTGSTQMQVDFDDYHNGVAYIKVESFSEGTSLYELKGEVIS